MSLRQFTNALNYLEILYFTWFDQYTIKIIQEIYINIFSLFIGNRGENKT